MIQVQNLSIKCICGLILDTHCVWTPICNDWSKLSHICIWYLNFVRCYFHHKILTEEIHFFQNISALFWHLNLVPTRYPRSIKAKDGNSKDSFSIDWFIYRERRGEIELLQNAPILFINGSNRRLSLEVFEVSNTEFFFFFWQLKSEDYIRVFHRRGCSNTEVSFGI